jgi:hypothetical protein
MKRVFKVNGKPFFPIGSEFLYVSGYSIRDKSEVEAPFKAVNMAHGNTALIPIYWDEVEPEESKYDFTSVDALISAARKYKVRLILLWFATWKNGNMDFAPAWVKSNPKRFKRVISPTGKDVWVLSSHCKANLEADKKAFIALLKHLKVKDSAEQTVIGIQVENEPGIIGCDRDYGPEAQAEFDSPVPAKLISAMKKAGKGWVYNIWQGAGGKESGTWPEIFGTDAGELLTAWSMANYMDSIAKSGKAVYDLMMYINVWMMDQRWWPIAGEAYPSGGAVRKVLDIYKWFTPHIDLIAPDNYVGDVRSFERNCAAYSRDDNPFFVPESLGGLQMLRAIADYNAVGYTAWIRVAPDNSVNPEMQLTMNIIGFVEAAIPLLLKFQGTGNVHSVIQEEDSVCQHLDFDGYMGLIEFGDWRPPFVRLGQADNSRGGGLVFQASKHEFYLVGVNYRLFLRRKPTLAKMQAPLLISTSEPKAPGYVISIDEGHFDQNGKYIVDRRRNGDQIKFGAWAQPSSGVVRVIMCDL